MAEKEILMFQPITCMHEDCTHKDCKNHIKNDPNGEMQKVPVTGCEVYREYKNELIRRNKERKRKQDIGDEPQ